MLEITARDIADLNDTDLRTLVARLAEAVLRARGLQTSAVTWGGDQNAGDGGIDVRVSLSEGTVIDGFVPRASTGFQAKKPGMSASAIGSEMKPGGNLRPSIAELANLGGAYIIVSSGSSVSDASLRTRLAAMKLAVADHPNGTRLKLDFYDNQRLATWVSDHPGIIPWVRSKVGRPLQGWQSHGNWSSPGQAPSPIILDGAVALHASVQASGLSVVEAIDRIRRLLDRPGTSVRLVGLSGVGKTRFIEALFEKDVGAEPLDPTRCIYTDMSHHPDPPPLAMATYLRRSRFPSILVIDNCPPDLHRDLTACCAVIGSTVSVVTVEYDIRDDEPENTDVFRMEAASPVLVTKLVKRRFPSISDVDADTVGKFSGGNSRVGLALCKTLQAGETLAGLSDDALFRKLFSQRNDPDSSLLASAEACALVYSFEGETLDGPTSELSSLGQLAGCNADQLYGHVAELMRRGLVQKRSVWRAVLPHAIANRLAERALENIPTSKIESLLVEGGSDRVFRSFTRRLGYLHRSPHAVHLTKRLLADGGFLGDIGYLNALGAGALQNVAPTCPSDVLEAFERAARNTATNRLFNVENSNRSNFAHLLRKLAYESSLFDRAVLLLTQFSERELEDQKNDSVTDILAGLFFPILSGTHAPAAQRAKVISSLLQSHIDRRQQIGVRLLGAALETYHFSSNGNFDFGARPRDYGYMPRTASEQLQWYTTFIQIAIEIAVLRTTVATAVRSEFAAKLPGLWSNTEAHSLLESACRLLSADCNWMEGWVAIRQALAIHKEDAEQERWRRLSTLEREMAPSTLAQEVEAYVLNDSHWFLDYDASAEAIGVAMSRASERAEGLGERLARDPAALETLLPRIVTLGNGNSWHLAQGLGRGSDSHVRIWQQLVNATTAAGRQGSTTALSGFLLAWQKSDPVSVRHVLEMAVDDPELGRWFPQIQMALGLDGQSLARLHRALSLGLASARSFSGLAMGRLTDQIATSELAELLMKISECQDGWAVALDILSMRFSSAFSSEAERIPLTAVGRQLLRNLDAAQKPHQGLDHSLSVVAATTLIGEEGRGVATAVCQKLIAAAAQRPMILNDYHSFVRSLFKVQPSAALTAFLRENGGGCGGNRAHRIFDDLAEFRGSPLSAVGNDAILEWCGEAPNVNFEAAASVVVFCKTDPDAVVLAWSDLAIALLREAPNPQLVLRQFVDRFRPLSWSGSRAAIMEGNAKLLQLIIDWNDPQLSPIARAEFGRIALDVAKEREWEARLSRNDNERFE